MSKEHKSGNTAVGAFIRDESGKYLLIQRPDHCSYCPTCWEVPGGKMDPGEKPEQAVVREVLEETGLSIELDEVIGEADFKAKGKQLVMRYWRARVIDGEVRLSQEHQAFQWLPISGFFTRKLTPALEDFLLRLPPTIHKELVQEYIQERPNFVVYAETLEQVLREACKHSFPEALVQSRAKKIPSFAEKIVRKWHKYKDPVHQMTDLCGARVIVQTAEQVKAISRFIEANFVICQKEDKDVLLGKDKFGYRDLHYIIQLNSGRAGILRIEKTALQTIGDRKAEIQVRTWVQHAWADTLHDRMYKNQLKLSDEVVRTGNLLAALMEEGDRTFNRLADDLDGLIANYTAYASKEEVEKEIEIRQMILDNELDESKKPDLALHLARLVAASGDYNRIEKLLKPYANMEDGCRYELIQEYGYALCKVHRESPGSQKYKEGLDLLEKSLRICGSSDITCVSHLRKKKSLHARVSARLGWAQEAVKGKEDKVREYYRTAHEIEPSNPYYLSEMLGYEIGYEHTIALPAAIRITLREAVKACREHAISAIELPFAYFTAGRLNILLEQPIEALGWYARGIQYALAGKYCVPQDIFAIEIDWINRLHLGHPAPPDHQQATELLTLAQDILNKNPIDSPRSSLAAPILIVAGGAATMNKSEILQDVNKYLSESMGGFKGTVISGGTMSGVPSCVGSTAAEFKTQGIKQFHLISYIPKLLANDAPLDNRYDNHVTVGKTFSPEQILGYWKDILASKIQPTDVILLGFGGGPTSGLEYRLALGFGATVGLVAGMGGSADEIVKDSLWSALPNLLPLPADLMTVRAFLYPDKSDQDKADLEVMAQEFHLRYTADNIKKLPENLKPWDKLNNTYKKANREQAKYAIQILRAAGFEVHDTENPDKPVIFNEFTDEEVEFMAQLEHGRWNIERLKDGWRYGARDDETKHHNCLIPWEQLPDGPDGVRKYDRAAVRAFPEILAKAGLEVFRK